MPSFRWWRLAGALAVVATLVGPALAGAGGGRVMAHAQLVASSPAAGAVLPASPDEIRLVFSEPLEAQATSLDVAVLDGATVLARAGEIDPADRFALVVADPQLADGIYVLTWRTLSAADGHTEAGFLTFGIGAVEGAVVGDPGGGMLHARTDPIAVVGRWLTYVGLLLALGMAVFHRIVVRRGPMPRSLARALAAALLLSAAATAVAAIASGAEAGSVADYLLASRNGSLQLSRALVAGAGGAALLMVPTRLAGGVAASSGVAGIVLLVAAGHASALPGPVPTASQAVHVAAAAVWIGGIVGLLGVILRPAAFADGPPPTMRALVPRFSALALTSIGLVALTGVYAAFVQTATLLDVGTEYGRTLLMKSAFALGAFALGGLNFLDGGRMMGWLDGFRSRVTIELMLAATVLVLTAALAITPPVDEPAGIAIEPLPDSFGTVAPGMGMEIVPGRPGLNRIVVTTTDALAGSASLDLAMDRLDGGTSTRVPLVLEPLDGMSHSDEPARMSHAADDGSVAWMADAVVLPAGSRWDTSVRILSGADDIEISRQRFAFALSATGVAEGRLRPIVDPAVLVAAALVVGGGLGLGLGLGGASLPRCEAGASRLALIGGGTIALVLGAAMSAARLFG